MQMIAQPLYSLYEYQGKFKAQRLQNKHVSSYVKTTTTTKTITISHSYSIIEFRDNITGTGSVVFLVIQTSLYKSQ